MFINVFIYLLKIQAGSLMVTLSNIYIYIFTNNNYNIIFTIIISNIYSRILVYNKIYNKKQKTAIVHSERQIEQKIYIIKIH